MPRETVYMGQHFSFPDDASDEEVNSFLASDWETRKPTLGSAFREIPAEAGRQFREMGQGAAIAWKDVFGGDIAENLAALREMQNERAKATLGMTLGQEILLQGGTSVLVNAPAMIGGIGGGLGRLAVSRGVAGAAERAAQTGLSLGTTIAGGETGLGTYAHSREFGLGPARSATHALLDAAIEKYTEYYPAAWLTKSAGKGLWETVKGFAKREIFGEEIATTLQSLNAKLSYQPDMTIGDYLRDVVVTAGATAIAGPVQGGIIRGATAMLPGMETGQPPAPEPAPAQPGAAPPVAPPTPPAPRATSVQELLSRNRPLPTQQSPTVREAEPQEAPPAGSTRLYFVAPEGATELPETVIATTSREEAQRAVQILGGGAVMRTADANAEQLQLMHEQAVDLNKDLQRQITNVQTQRAVPGSLFLPAPPVVVSNPETQEVKAVSQTPPSGEAVSPPVTPPQPPGVSGPTKLRVRVGGKDRTINITPEGKALYRLGTAINRFRRGEATIKEYDDLQKLAEPLMQTYGLRYEELRSVAQAYRAQLLERMQAQEGPEVELPRVSDLVQTAAPVIEGALPPSDRGRVVLSPTATAEINSLPHDSQVSALRMVNVFEGWMKVFAPGATVTVRGLSHAGVAGSLGTTDTPGVYALMLPHPRMNTLQRSSSLAHEFGHLLIFHHLDKPDNAAVRARLEQEHAGILAQLPQLSAREFLKLWGSPIRASRSDKIIEKLGLDPETATALEYVAQIDKNWSATYIDRYGQEAYEQVLQRYGPHGYILSFDEYGAEQTSRYFNARGDATLPAEYRSFWNELIDLLKEFYSKVVTKFETQPEYARWLESLNAYGLIQEVQKEQAKPVPPVADFAPVADVWDDLTTKVLTRLPSKDRIKKFTIDQELRRSDVRDQEREAVRRVLARMPGEAVDRHRFVEEVMKEVVPVEYGVSSSRWADYGAARVLPLNEFSWVSGKTFGTSVVASNVYHSPVEVSPKSNHFNDPRYFAHTRIWDMPKMSVFGPDARILAEVQSDVLQGEGGTTTIEDINRLTAERDAIQREYDTLPENRVGIISQPAYGRVLTVQDRLLTARNQLSEAWADFERSKQRQAFTNAPKRWWELIIRLEMKRAAAQGKKTFIVPSAETLARIEGWQKDFIEGEWQTEEQASWPDDVMPIYRRYDKDIPRFLKREYGAEEMTVESPIAPTTGWESTDSQRMPGVDALTWWRMPVKPELQSLPVEYFDLLPALEDAMEETEKVAPLHPDVPKAFKRMSALALYNLQLNQLTRILPNVPGIREFRDAFRNLTNMKNRIMVAPNERLKEWFKLSPRQDTKVSAILRAEVNAGEHWTTLTQQADGQWVHEAGERFLQEVQARQLSEKAAKLVLGVKNDFLVILQQMENTLIRSVARYFRNNPVAGAHRIAEVRAEFQRFREKPYLPDRGFGRFSVKIHAKQDYLVEGRQIRKGELIYWEKFESERAQQKKLRVMKAQYEPEFTISASKLEDTPHVLRGLPTKFVTNMIETLQLTPEQVEQLQQLQYDATKEGAFFKLLGKGKKFVGGSSEDIRRVYADYMWRTANFIAKMHYAPDVNDAKALTAAYGRQITESGGDSNVINDIHGHMTRLTDYVLKPQHELEMLRAIVSLWYLWAVPRTAMMNFMSIPVTGWSHLAAKYGDAGATGALLKALKDVAANWKHPERIGGEDADALNRALADGVTDQSYAAEMAAVSDGPAIERLLPHFSGVLRESGVSDTTQKVVWNAVHWGMLPFRAIEQYNRRVMVLASFRLARQKGENFESAYQSARDSTDYTQNDYSPWNRPVLLQGKKSAFLIFFSFIQNMSFFLYGGDRGWWRALIVLAALGGLQALPGIDNLMDVLSWAWTKFSGERTDLREEARKFASAVGANPDYFMHGLPRALLPGDISASISMGRIIPGTDILTTYSDDATSMVNALAEVGGPFGSLAVSGLKALMDPNPNQLMRFERILPTAVRNVSRSLNMAESGEMVNTRGQTLVSDATPTEIVGQALGFTPTRRAQTQEELFEKRNAAEYYIHRRANLLYALWIARDSGDADMEAQVRHEIMKYNDRAPYPQLRINGRDIADSFKRRRENERAVEQQRPREKRFQRLYREMDDLYNQP